MGVRWRRITLRHRSPSPNWERGRRSLPTACASMHFLAESRRPCLAGPQAPVVAPDAQPQGARPRLVVATLAVFGPARMCAAAALPPTTNCALPACGPASPPSLRREALVVVVVAARTISARRARARSTTLDRGPAACVLPELSGKWCISPACRGRFRGEVARSSNSLAPIRHQPPTCAQSIQRHHVPRAQS